MKQDRTWLSLLSYCVLLALGAALVIAVIVAGASVALASHQDAAAQEASDLSAEQAAQMPPATSATPGVTRFTGMITDSHCGPRHMRNSGMNSGECARACFRKGASYILLDGDKRYTLIGGDGAVEKLVGERATVTGTQQEDAIIVDAAAPQIQ